MHSSDLRVIHDTNMNAFWVSNQKNIAAEMIINTNANTIHIVGIVTHVVVRFAAPNPTGVREIEQASEDATTTIAFSVSTCK